MRIINDAWPSAPCDAALRSTTSNHVWTAHFADQRSNQPAEFRERQPSNESVGGSVTHRVNHERARLQTPSPGNLPRLRGRQQTEKERLQPIADAICYLCAEWQLCAPISAVRLYRSNSRKLSGLRPSQTLHRRCRACAACHLPCFQRADLTSSLEPSSRPTGSTFRHGRAGEGVQNGRRDLRNGRGSSR